MAYSIDLRKKVMDFIGQGHSQRHAHRVFGIARGTVNQWYGQYHTTGSLESNYAPRRHRKLDPEKLIVYVREHPDAYAHEMGEALGCSDVAVLKALKRLGITRKKRANATRNKIPQR